MVSHIYQYPTNESVAYNLFGEELCDSSTLKQVVHRVRKKRVFFSEKTHAIQSTSSHLSTEDVETCWWGQEELDSIKATAKATIHDLRQKAGEEGCLLTTAHKKTRLMLKSNMKELIKLSPSSPDEDLQKWCAFNDGRRGLERFASSEYSLWRIKDIVRTRKHVLEEQRMQRKLRVTDPQLIAAASKQTSRRARTFALYMGEADAVETNTSRKRRKLL